MEYNQIYTFGNKCIRGSYHAATLDRKGFLDSYELLRGELEITAPLEFGYLTGKNIYDIVGTGQSISLLSDRVTNLLREHQVTGWKTYPAILYDRKGNEIEGYSIFSVTGRCGPIDWSKSEVFYRKLTPEGEPARMIRGLYPDLGLWDGSDVFVPEGTAHTFVTKKVRDLLVKNKATNILLEKLTEVEQIDSFKPGDVDEEVLKAFLKSMGVEE